MEADADDLRARVLRFVEEVVYPREAELEAADDATRDALLRTLSEQARSAGLWALGHPRELGGGGLSFMAYVRINEVIGRSYWAMLALGTASLQDSLMVWRHGTPAWHERYLRPIVAGEFLPSFAMTEPEVSSSDPTQLATTARLEDGHWVVNGRKWFTTGAAQARYTTVMCRTEDADAPPHRAFSLIIVPTDAPGYRIVRDLPALGIAGNHYEIALEDLRVPEDHLLGRRGAGFAIAQERLGPGRIFHCMRWLGQAQRAFDLMCRRLHARSAFGEALAEKQLMQAHVFESAAEIRSARELTLAAARRMDSGDQARDEIAVIKVLGARMLHNVIDRAIQVYGAAGLTPDTPLSVMYRHAREARIYDGPDEVHMQSVARRLLKAYRDDGPGIDFGAEPA
ncbi:acyl-CoA dehydrogenase family protein [Algiphilus sp.]|uniref:acyl-CoA dehydrogenase family protein n=1 Tax=Algiphilus sp. TaxID=1872431 RepID=UPI0025B93042|nr:acyl-CoA dehydrogenase family protein [Algiphilus sp.]MCK5769905.1 acyl-CoA dehydrogenase family protein [Algiphilus sp.]